MEPCLKDENRYINARELLSKYYDQIAGAPATQQRNRAILRMTVTELSILRGKVSTMQWMEGSPYAHDDPRPDDAMKLLLMVATKGTKKDEATVQRCDECLHRMLLSMAKHEYRQAMDHIVACLKPVVKQPDSSLPRVWTQIDADSKLTCWLDGSVLRRWD